MKGRRGDVNQRVKREKSGGREAEEIVEVKKRTECVEKRGKGAKREKERMRPK